MIVNERLSPLRAEKWRQTFVCMTQNRLSEKSPRAKLVKINKFSICFVMTIGTRTITLPIFELFAISFHRPLPLLPGCVFLPRALFAYRIKSTTVTWLLRESRHKTDMRCVCLEFPSVEAHTITSSSPSSSLSSESQSNRQKKFNFTIVLL